MMKEHYQHQSVSRIGTVAIAVYLVFVNLGALIALFIAWPGMENLLPNLPSLPDEIRYLLIALVGGMLGTSVVLLVSFATYAGNGALVASWSLWYILRPFIGMTTGLLVYAAIRGGILKVSSAVDVLNPFAITVISAAAGLYSKQLLDKLHDWRIKGDYDNHYSDKFVTEKGDEEEK